jgi:hypothetical protein
MEELMGCSMCGVSTESPCAIICYSDCSVCWVDAPAMAAKMVMDIGSDVPKSGRDIKLTGSTEVRFSCNKMPVDRLIAFLKLAYPEGRIGKPAEDVDAVSKAATGTLDEVIKQIGFEAAAD